MYRLLDFVVQSAAVCGLPWLLAWVCVAPIEWDYQRLLAECDRLNAESDQRAASIRNTPVNNFGQNLGNWTESQLPMLTPPGKPAKIEAELNITNIIGRCVSGVFWLGV